jgi:hypothetical protein
MILFYLLLFLNLNANAATVQNGIIPSEFSEGHYSMDFETTYLSTNANYTNRGTSLDFNPGFSYKAYQSNLFGRYDFSNRLSGFSELPLNFAQSENATDGRSSFKVPGVALGINYDFNFRSFKIVTETNGYYALEKFDRSSDDVLSSDGASYINGGAHFFKNFRPFQFHSYLSFEYRLDGFSALVNYQADLSYKKRNSSYTFGLKGFQSVIDDLNTDNPSARHNYLNVVNGSSLLYGSVNPSRLDIFTQAKFTVNDAIDLYGSIDKSIRGKNSGDILCFTVGLEYFFEPSISKNNKQEYHLNENFESEDERTEHPAHKKIIKRSEKKEKEEEKIETEPEAKPPVKPKPKIVKVKPKPKLKPVPVKPIAPNPNFTPTKSSKPNKNGLVVSKKYLGKKTTSTSPVKSKPKSKKIKRVRIDF